MRRTVLTVSGGLILVSGLLALTLGASEPVRRNIIYLHVPPALTCLGCFVVLFVCSIQYLRTRSQRWDFTAAAAGQVGLVFATVLNATGMIFARAEWGLWWTASPRLVTSALLWFLYMAYCLLRASLPEQRRRGRIAAVFGIIAFIDVPLVFLSARFIRDIHRPGFSFETPGQSWAFALGLGGTLLLAAGLIWIRADILAARSRVGSDENRKEKC